MSLLRRQEWDLKISNLHTCTIFDFGSLCSHYLDPIPAFAGMTKNAFAGMTKARTLVMTKKIYDNIKKLVTPAQAGVGLENLHSYL